MVDRDDMSSEVPPPNRRSMQPGFPTASRIDRYFICPNPNCGYSGIVRGRSAGSLFVAFVLLLLWIIPGIFYLLYACGHEWVCPRCNMRLARERT